MVSADYIEKKCMGISWGGGGGLGTGFRPSYIYIFIVSIESKISSVLCVNLLFIFENKFD